MSLISLVTQSQELEKQLIESGGEISPEMESAWMDLKSTLPEKVDSCAFLIKKCKANHEFYKAQADEIYKIANSFKSVVERINDNVKFTMVENNLTELKGNDVRFLLSKGKPSIKIDEKELDEAYKHQVVSTEIDKKKVEDDLKLGVPVKGARLIENVALRSYANKRDS